MMNFGPLESGAVFLLIFALYIIPIVFVVYWMIKILRNSNENLKTNKEILEILKNKNNEDR